MEQFACVVDLLARAGQLEDVVQFITSMPIKPDKSIWGDLLAACQAHQNIIIGNLAALFWLKSENPGNYVTLSNIYAKAGRWSDEVAVRKLMEST
ncbi:Pentatricopeptide repeat-containing protein, partial [Thalictrum thalictroides]